MATFNGRWIKAYKKKVTFPNGVKAVWEIVDQSPAAIVLPVFDDGSVLLIREYRPAIGRWIYGLPAGLLDKGEKAIGTARRELVEESGYSCSSMRYLFKSYSSPGKSTELVHFFLATGLKKAKQRLERHEMLTVKRVPMKRALQMVRENRIANGNTIQLLLFYNSFIKK